MKVLGLMGWPGANWSHDGSAAVIVDNQIACAIEQERITRQRYANAQGCADAAMACLNQVGLALRDIDHIAYGWLGDASRGTSVGENIVVSQDLTTALLPPERFGYADPPAIHGVRHHFTHAAASYLTSGFKSAAVLVIDGQGEGESISLYHATSESSIKLIETYPIDCSLGIFYTAAGMHAGFGVLSGPGKLMGLSPFGKVRAEVALSFDAEAGRFTLPESVREGLTECSGSITSENLGQLWMDYFRDAFYPYINASGDAYHVAHYADFAASVQHSLETSGIGLAKRIKKLTGERNLVLSGGCALNCSMNAAVSRASIFDHLYVFPGANDAGSSIGAALAVSYAFGNTRAKPSRLIAPTFGRQYRDEEIARAIEAAGFVAERLDEIALCERVAEDLANNRIVAWFSGRDEFGPRALGCRSFLAHPGSRENLGRLNKLKGRERWRPLAPSILEEHAAGVLEGTMETGLHRYMLGVATIRPDWRAKIPALVHVDHTTRPHFVRREDDGRYWLLIETFYRVTGIPLVCNTSLNVAGKPLCHRPEHVLEIFAARQDVHTVVIEGFYLTRQASVPQSAMAPPIAGGGGS